MADEIVRAALEMRRANPRWAAQKIMGELRKLGFQTCQATVQRILRDAGFPPRGSRYSGYSWRGFIQSHGKRLFACDFFIVDTLFMQKLHVFFMIDVTTRAIELVSVKTGPNGEWLRNLLRSFLAFAETQPEILIADRDGVYKDCLDLW